MRFYHNKRIWSTKDSEKNFYFICGNRNIGKTVWANSNVLDRYYRFGHKVLLVTRTKEEYRSTLEAFAPKAHENRELAFPEDEFIVKGDKLVRIADGDIVACAISLKDAVNAKRREFLQYNNLIFDEFMPMDNSYLHKYDIEYEPSLCETLFQTVARGEGEPFRKGIKFIFLSNAISLANPYFLKYGIKFDLTSDGFKKSGNARASGPGWRAELFYSGEVADTIRETEFAKGILSTGAYGAHALDNKFYLDDYTGIREFSSKDDKPFCLLIIGPYKYTLCKSVDDSFFISNKENGVSPNACLIAGEAIMDNKVKFFHRSSILRILQVAREMNKLYYNDLNVKNVIIELIRYNVLDF